MKILAENKAVENLTFQCDLYDKDLFNCILRNLEEPNLEELTGNVSVVDDIALDGCLKAGLVTCLRNNAEEFELEGHRPKVEVHAILTEKGRWKIQSFNLIVSNRINDEFAIQRINQCIKFIKSNCNVHKSVDFNLKNPEPSHELKHFKLELQEAKSWLDEIKNDNQQKTELLDTFNRIAKSKVKKGKEKRKRKNRENSD